LNKPNILFIQADQLTASLLASYGNVVAKTPHLDKLADASTVFENAYSNFPLCAPSRFSMLSGMLASRIGAYDNGAEFPSAVPTVAHYLRAAGYQTCLTGKMHFVGADQLHGFEERLTTDIYPADFNWTGDWTEKTPEFANDSRSFMVSFTHPHDPYQCSAEHWNRYRHEDIDMPGVPDIKPADNDPYSLRLRTLSGLDVFQPDDAQIRRARHAYYGSLSYLDDQIGQLLKTLDLAGFAENTAIVFTSDHGDMLGERGLWYKKCFFEDACKVPLYIHHPDLAGGRCAANVSLVDLLPTLLDIGAVEVAPIDRLDGHSLTGLMNDSSAAWSNRVMVENLAEGVQAPAVMIRDDDQKFVHCELDPPQLYNLSEDPDEMRNLAVDADLQYWQQQVTDVWSLEELGEAIQLSQRRRLFLRGALREGVTSSWDFKATDQADNNCLREGQVYNNWAYDDVLKLNPDSK